MAVGISNLMKEESCTGKFKDTDDIGSYGQGLPKLSPIKGVSDPHALERTICKV